MVIYKLSHVKYKLISVSQLNRINSMMFALLLLSQLVPTSNYLFEKKFLYTLSTIYK